MPESKDYAWEFLTASRCITDKRCELAYAELVPSADAADATLYDGQSTAGKKIVTIMSGDSNSWPFKPPVPIYCEKGIYVAHGSNVTGVLVQWRHL